jgi:EmrB/QacA subfamily drug resistance transporter
MTTILERQISDVSSTAAPTRETAPVPDRPAAPKGMWLGFFAVLAALILNILDSTIVNVAAPAIQRDLSMSTASLEWIAAGYTLALSVGIIAGARLGDMFGRRRMLVAGLTGFIVASVACSVAWSSEVLVGGRVVQGLAAAVMIPQCFGLIRDLFPPHLIGKGFAALGPVIGLSTVLGPVVAGLLMRADVLGSGWRSLFWINIPVGVFALVVGLRTLPSNPPSHAGHRLDLVGTVLLAATSFLVVFPLVDGRTLGWPTWVFGVLAAAVPVFAVFLVQQRARVRRDRPTLVELSVLKKRSYVSGVVFTLFFFGSVVGFSLTVGLFLQIGLGFTAMHASLYLAAMAVGAFFGAGVGAWATTAVGRPILHVGLSGMLLGLLVLWLSMRHVDGVVGFGALAPGLFLFGLGMGMIFVPLFSIIMGEIEDHEVGSATGMLESQQQLGASLGVAVLATVFFDTLRLEDGGASGAVAAGRALLAAEHTLVAVGAAVAVAWLLAWFLPKQARVEDQ